MGKSRKRRKAGYENVLKAEHMQEFARAQVDAERDETNDNYLPPAKQQRRFENQFHPHVTCRRE